MQPQDNNTSLAEKAFESVYNLLMQNPQERQRFLREPEKVLTEKGIHLDSNAIETLKRVCNLSIDADRMNFNEKLVLSSSPGY